MVTADEVGRSLRGTVDLLNQRVEGLQAFDFSETSFWRSFSAVLLTLPAYVVSLSLERQRLFMSEPSVVVGDGALMVLIALSHLAGFVALPIVMIWIARRLHLGHRYVPFVIVINWIAVIGMNLLSLPAALLLMGWATPSLAWVFTVGFAVVLLRLQWFGTKVTLGVPGSLAAAIVALGVGLNFVVGALFRTLIG